MGWEEVAYWRPSLTGSSVLASASVLYATLLVAVYTVPATTGLITTPDPYLPHNTDDVVTDMLMYLFTVSIAFMLYMFIWLTRPSRSQAGHHANGSAFVRVGAVVFGVASILYLGFSFGDSLAAPACAGAEGARIKAAKALGLVFSILQLVAIILFPRAKFDQHRGAAHFGLMHLIATNLVFWMWAVEIESIHIQHKAVKCFDYGVKKRFAPLHTISKRAPAAGQCDLWEGAAKGTAAYDLEPIFYPFLIEFTLIGIFLLPRLIRSSSASCLLSLPHLPPPGVTVFLNTWRQVEAPDGHGEASSITWPHPIAYITGQVGESPSSQEHQSAPRTGPTLREASL